MKKLMVMASESAIKNLKRVRVECNEEAGGIGKSKKKKSLVLLVVVRSKVFVWRSLIQDHMRLKCLANMRFILSRRLWDSRAD